MGFLVSHAFSRQLQKVAEAPDTQGYVDLSGCGDEGSTCTTLELYVN
jgi:hypothetical protein